MLVEDWDDPMAGSIDEFKDMKKIIKGFKIAKKKGYKETELPIFLHEYYIPRFRPNANRYTVLNEIMSDIAMLSGSFYDEKFRNLPFIAAIK